MSEIYRRGFEIKNDQKSVDEKTEDLSFEKGSNSAYRRGFTLDSEPDTSKIIRANEVNSDEMTTIEIDDPSDESDEQLRTKFWSSPLLWFLLLVTSVGGLQVYSLLSNAFAENSVSGYIWSTIILVVLFLAFGAVWKELRSVWRLRNCDKLRDRLRQICDSGNGQDAINLCSEMYKSVNHKDDSCYKDFKTRVKPHFSPAEVFSIYENLVLKDLDLQVKKCIVKRSRENGVVVALSPIAWLDMAFTVARSLRMIREIAEIYGYHCGLWGRYQLYRRIIKNVIFIGMTDLATDAIMDSVGSEFLGKVSAAVGQGIAAGIYSTRLGYMTMKAVRPIPISKEVVTLGELRKDMVSGALEILKDQKTTEK